MKLSIVMPTIPGRDTELARSMGAYQRLTPNIEIEWVVERGHPNCGAAWNAGVTKCTGDIIHMGADDIEPETNAWFPAAMQAINQGNIPLGLVREDVVGTFGRDFARVVICKREWWQNVPDIHYWSDNAFTDLMQAAGHEPTVVEGFDFYHRRSMIGRDESTARLHRDYHVYLEQRR